ncbi:MAG TPA: outer membrane beta-barrel protein [Prolixibacteraceae bacterium]|nr:outer membrane beta-barrel protein [Prolixibacteraceae bacterium]HPS11994.1 outer membrane beta-barrel protein [Prolixibacteraceae bacterium]
MKTQILLVILIFVSATLFAQNDTLTAPPEPVEPFGEEVISEPVDSAFDVVPEEGEIDETPEAEFSDEEFNSERDTVHVRVGKHAIEIVTKDGRTQIDVDKLDDYQSQWKDNKNWEEPNEDQIETIHRHRHHKKFDGHWAGIDFGGNQLWNTTYPTTLYPEGTPEFLTTSPEKSFEVNLNLFEYSFGFSSYIGFVTGLGFNFNDYKFKNRYTIEKDDNGVIQPAALPEGDFRVSKLSTTFLTAPLLLEIQIPGQWDHDRMFIAGGVIGGVKLHEHTKTKIGDEKKRDNGDHNIAPLRWGYTARIGFENVGVYATYYNTKLFEEGKGPDTTPVTIGLTFTF